MRTGRPYLSERNLDNVRHLNDIARQRGQSLAQMALGWALHDPRVTSVLFGASRPGQIDENVAAVDRLDFTEAELREIDKYAQEGDINLWAASSEAA